MAALSRPPDAPPPAGLRDDVVRAFSRAHPGEYDLGSCDRRGVPTRRADGRPLGPRGRTAAAERYARAVHHVLERESKARPAAAQGGGAPKDRGALPAGYWDRYPMAQAAKNGKGDGVRRLGVDFGGVIAVAPPNPLYSAFGGGGHVFATAGSRLRLSTPGDATLRDASPRQHIAGVPPVSTASSSSTSSTTSVSSSSSLVTTPLTDECVEGMRHLVSVFGPEHVFIVTKATASVRRDIEGWLVHQDFYDRTGVMPMNVFFCTERAQKGTIAAELGLTHFIDDRWSALKHMPGCEALYLFPNDSDHSVPTRHRVGGGGNLLSVRTWDEVLHDLGRRPELELIEPTYLFRVWCEWPATRDMVQVNMRGEFAKRPHSVADAFIGEVWAQRKAENPKLFNGTKFRLARVSVPGKVDMMELRRRVLMQQTSKRVGLPAGAAGTAAVPLKPVKPVKPLPDGGTVKSAGGETQASVDTGGEQAGEAKTPPVPGPADGMDVTDEHCGGARTSVQAATSPRLQLGMALTNYATFLGTNWNPRYLEFFGDEQDPSSYMADPLGVGAVAVTADTKIMMIRRSRYVAEFPYCLDVPGGHPEPSAVAGCQSAHAADQRDFSKVRPQDVVDELFDSIRQEVVDEIGVPMESLDEPILLGIMRQNASGGRPSCVFALRCALQSDAVLACYKAGPKEAFETTALSFVDPKDLPLVDPNELMDGFTPAAVGALWMWQRFIARAKLETPPVTPREPLQHARARGRNSKTAKLKPITKKKEKDIDKLRRLKQQAAGFS